MVSTSGSELTISAVDGRWVTNAGKNVTKSATYDVALTFADDTELANIIGPATQANADGSDVDSAETSAITGVSGGGSYASTWYEDGTAVTDDPVNNSWAEAFNGTQTALSDGIYGNPGTEYTFDQPMVGTWIFDVYLGGGVNTSSQDLLRLDDYQVDGDDPNWTIFGESQFGRFQWTGTVNKITLPNGAMYLNKVTFNDAFLIVGNAPAGTPPAVLTLTDDKDLANFMVGDAVSQTGSLNMVIALGNNTSESTLGVDAFNANPGEIVGAENGTGNLPYFAWSAASPGTITWTGANVGTTLTYKVGTISGTTFTTSGDIYDAGSFTVGASTIGYDNADSFTFTPNAASGSLTISQTSPTSIYVYGRGPTGIAGVVTAVGPGNTLTVAGGTWSVGTTVSKDVTLATIGTVVSVDGTTLYGSTVTGDFYVGKYLKGAEITAEAPSPSEIVFTSMNGGTTAFTGTDATLSARLWSLESGSSASGPWTAVGDYLDISAFASQDGATPWATAPALDPNTFYRVKVEYQSDNADSVVSNQNTFKTGDA